MPPSDPPPPIACAAWRGRGRATGPKSLWFWSERRSETLRLAARCVVADVSLVHICQPGGPWALNIFHCPWCDCERDSIIRTVFSGYCAPDRICEWCGTWFSDSYRARMPERERDTNREKFQRVKADPATRRVEGEVELMDFEDLMDPMTEGAR